MFLFFRGAVCYFHCAMSARVSLEAAPRRRLALVAGLVLALALGYRLAFFGVSARQIPVASDEAIMLLQAKGILENTVAPSFQAKQEPRGVLGRFPLLMMAQPYLFPIEAYLMAPIYRLLPSGAVGARLPALLMGLATVWMGLLILRRDGSWRATWPGALLLLFPSAYLLILQVAFALPGYPAFMLFSLLAIWLAFKARDAVGGGIGWAAGAGLIGGLVTSTSLLALPALISAGAVILLFHDWRKTLWRLPVFGATAALGLAPYFLAKLLYPGAHAAVSGTQSLARVAGAIWSPLLTFTLPATLGVGCPRFPDTKETIRLIPGLETPLAVLWLVLMLVAAVVCLAEFGRRLFKARRLAVEPLDVFVALCGMGLMLFILNPRSHAHTYRYLLYLALALPFIVGFLYAAAGRRARRVLGALAISLAVLNLGTATAVMRAWSRSGFAREIKLFDLRPAIAYLDERGIHHCYATYFDSYRMNYATDERILCSQSYNERFPGWPLPYKAAVDAATNVACVSADGFRFKPDDVERSLRRMGLDFHKERHGDYTIFTDFSRTGGVAEARMEPARLRFASGGAARGLDALADGRYDRWWRQGRAQAAGDWIEVELGRTAAVCRVALFYDGYPFDRAPALDLMGRMSGRWQPLAVGVKQDTDEFAFINGHPVWGHTLQTIRFEPTLTDALKIQIAVPAPGRDWTIGEVEVFERVGD